MHGLQPVVRSRSFHSYHQAASLVTPSSCSRSASFSGLQPSLAEAAAFESGLCDSALAVSSGGGERYTTIRKVAGRGMKIWEHM